MQNSAEHKSPHQIRSFFEKLCLISQSYAKKQRAMEELDRQLGKLRKTHVGRSLPRDKDISTIKAQVSEILDSERKIAGSRKRNTGHERELLQKIENLENELKIVKGERDEAVELNKERIHELTATLLSVKTRINTFAERKEERERRIKELESKIKKT